MKPEKIAALIADHPDASIVCPVYAEEATGRNKIPRAFAKYIAKVAGIETDQGIMQSVRAFHSGATAEHRLFVSPEFDGKVTPGAEYILVDDHITQGGTVNALRDHIEANGGKVVAIAALTLSHGSSILAPRKETLDEIKRKWPDIDDLLKSADIAERADALTESQLRYILKFSPDTFRDRVAQAGREGGGQGAGRALRGREAASEGTPSEGVSRESLPAPLTETPSGRGRTRSSVRRWGSAGLANVATALFAQQLLAGKEVSAEEADSLLRNIGLGALPAPALLKKAKELAEENREKVKRLVRDNAPELVDALVQSGLEAQFRDALDGAITGAAEAADPSVGREVQKAVQRHETRELMAAKGFDAAQMMAELPIDLARGLLATADRAKTPEEIAKLEEARKRREEERAAAEAEMTDEERLAAVDDPSYVPPSEESLALFRQLYDSAKSALEARQAEERRAAAEKARRNAEGQQDESGETADDAGSAPSAQADADALLPAETVARTAPVFDSPELFAQFLVEWTAKHVVERHPNIPSTAQMWKNPVAVRELKQTATGILRRLARDCLGSPSLNHARNFVDHLINGLESDAETRTYKAGRRRAVHVRLLRGQDPAAAPRRGRARPSRGGRDARHAGPGVPRGRRARADAARRPGRGGERGRVRRGQPRHPLLDRHLAPVGSREAEPPCRADRGAARPRPDRRNGAGELDKPRLPRRGADDPHRQDHKDGKRPGRACAGARRRARRPPWPCGRGRRASPSAQRAWSCTRPSGSHASRRS